MNDQMEMLLRWITNRVIQRIALIAMLMLMALVLAMALPYQQPMRQADVPWPTHSAHELYVWHEAIGKSAMREPTTQTAPCPELDVVRGKFDEKLDGAGYLNPVVLVAKFPGRKCEELAKRLARTVSSEWHLIGGAVRRDALLNIPHLFTVREIDYSTKSAWAGFLGCWRFSTGCKSSLAGAIADDKLAEMLAVRGNPKRYDLRQASEQVEFGNKTFPRGKDVVVTIREEFQGPIANLLQCVIGDKKACAATPSWFPQADRTMRAGAIGLAIIEIKTSRIVVLAGGSSDCVKDHKLHVLQTGNSAVSKDSPCANFPDKRMAFLADHHPATWPIPPGSTAKLPVVYAAVLAGLINRSNEGLWQARLAASNDLTTDGLQHQDAPRALALTLGPRVVTSYDALGYSSNTGTDYFFGVPSPLMPPLAVRPVALEMAPHMNPTQFFAIERALKADPKQAQRDFGHATIKSYLNARSLADAAIGGGGGMSISAIGLAELWRRLGAASSGQKGPTAAHLLEVPSKPILFPAMTERLDQAASNKMLYLTSKVTSRIGTAAQACQRMAGGSCDLSGKTGTSDHLYDEKDPLCRVKLVSRQPNGQQNVLQMPGKLFGAVFGKDENNAPKYAIGVTGLRVRAGQCLDRRNVAAEMGIAAMRVMMEAGA